MRFPRAAAASALVIAAACSRAGKSDPAKAAEAAEEIFILGRVVAANATVLRAPSNEFRVGGWGGGGGGVKFTELKSDGEKVRAGEVIARFKFDWDQALEYFESRLRSEKAAAGRSEIELEGSMRDLKSRRQRLRFAVELAKVDTKKGNAVSKNRLKYFEGTYELRQFEENALAERIAALERRSESEKRYYEIRTAGAQTNVNLFHEIKASFVLKAPHDGVIRHGFHPWKRRKIQIGDNMQGGMEAVSIAKDEALAVELFVPERKLEHFGKGREAVVRDPADNNRRHPVVVTAVEEFPQEIGFLIQDNDVPQAREKAFVVKAAFRDPPKKLTVGSEIKGEMP